MQRGIDSFFKRVPKPETAKDTETAQKKRKMIVYSSDEDEVKESPQQSNKHEHKKTRNDEKLTPTDRAKKPTPTKSANNALKKVDPKELFGGDLVRVEAPKPAKPKDITTIYLEDDDMDESLLEIDNNALMAQTEKARKIEKTTPSKTPKQEKTPNKDTRNGHHLENDSAKPQKSRKRSKSRETTSTTTPSPAKKQKLEVHNDSKEQAHTPVATKKQTHTTPVNKRQHKAEDTETTVLTDEERHERKRLTAILYQKYKNRSSCLNPGSKEVPKGKPNCLNGLTFLVTGILESLERDEANSIIKEYGGKVMSTCGKRLNYIIVGEEAGPKKLAQAEEHGTKVLTEDGFFDLIRKRSGEKATTNVKAEINEEKPSTSKMRPEKPAKKVETKQKTPRKENGHVSTNETKNSDERKAKVKQETTSESEQTSKVATVPSNGDNMVAWVDKYKPQSVKEIIGQQGAASNVVKLTNWLSKWYSNHDGKKKLQKPNPWAKNDDGSYYKAVLLSGPPGIGKTTTATLVCKELGFDTVEFNASDTRSKRLLKEEVAELLSNKSLYGFCHGNAQAVTKKHVLIMDEVDGMAGNEDRGGIQELIALIKESSVPIICMCNDRNHQKMRSLVNYCYDLRFQRPRLEQIKGRLLSILCREKIKIETPLLEEIITATNNDIRQSINHIALLSANKELDFNKTDAGKKAQEKIATKDLKMGPWDVVRKVFSADEHKRMNINDKCDLFFHDYSLAPLFVQQNYLQVSPHGPKSEVLQKVALTADSLSLGDLVDKRIRSRNAWTLLPTQAVFSSYMPGEFMCGHFTGQINFPAWLGKNSRANKRSRLAQELHDHTRLRTSGSRMSIRLDYAPFLLDKIVRPLKERGMDGVEESLSVLKEYHLLREDIDSLLELTSWPGKKSAFDAVDGRVKAALTRAYNKETLAYTYSAMAGVKKKRLEAAVTDEADLLGEGEEDVLAAASDDDKDDADDLENDGLIKAKKKATATKGAAATSSKGKGASTSKKAAAGESSKSKTPKAKK